MKNINKIFIIITLMLLLIIIFVDNETLNSLFINYNDIVVNEVAVLNVDYNKVIYTDTSSVSAANQTTTSNPATVQRTNINSTPSAWSWPTDSNYTITTYYSASHKAIDIYSYNGNGSNIYAANNGTVTMVKGGCAVGNLSCNGSGGNYIVIKHNSNNYYTVYMHLKDIRVNIGDTISRGQVIGTMGNTGNVIPAPTASSPYLGTHLHFCLYVGEPFKGGTPINPMNLY